MLLSVFLGQGTQIFIMTFITLCERPFTFIDRLKKKQKKSQTFLCLTGRRIKPADRRPVIYVYSSFVMECIDNLSTIVLACLGFLSPANRGALMTCAVVLWVLLGTPAGYVSARLYKSKSRTKKIAFLDVLGVIIDSIHDSHQPSGVKSGRRMCC